MSTSSSELPGLEHEETLPRWRDRLLFMLAFVALLWGVEVVDYLLSGARELDFTPERGVLDKHGIHPRESYGLRGILFAPFLHGGWGHLMGNTVPFFILGSLVMLSGLPVFLVTTVIVAVVGGFGTWLFGEPASHIGASGLIFGYLGFVVTRGFFTWNLWWILLGVGVGVGYSWMIKSLFQIEAEVSWVGHAFGLVGGVVAAWVVGTIERRKQDRVDLEQFGS